ncbi:OmpH family outer membrane protein [Halonatronum saccharophilum]|uniref:OmpH family outer membrane protein n=1 Tax=Halonatronum saccharophilum TaxID=150060 RepID=UPI000486FEBD|nr:OmpH family outer membrane protein [Halonatronum saccharophilum]
MFKRKFSYLVVGVLFLAAALLVNTGGTFAAGTNVAYVDLSEAYIVHPEVEKANQRLQERMGELQASLQEEASNLNPEEDAQKLQALQQNFQQQFEMEQREVQNSIFERLESDLDSFREKRGYDVILNGELIISGGQDVTAEVIEYFQSL